MQPGMLPQRWAILYLSLFLLQLTPAARGSDPHTVSRVLVDLRNRSQQIPEKAPNSEQSSTAEVGRGGAVRSEAGNTEEVKAESVNPVVTGQKLEERLIAALHRRYKGDLGGSKGKDEHYSLPELAEDEVLLAEKVGLHLFAIFETSGQPRRTPFSRNCGGRFDTSSMGCFSLFCRNLLDDSKTWQSEGSLLTY